MEFALVASVYGSIVMIEDVTVRMAGINALMISK